MKKIFYFTLMTLTLSSCHKDNLPINNLKEADKISVVGEKLENPYSLKNMNKAYVNLMRNKGFEQELLLAEPSKGSPMLLEPTHIYVRILPKDSAHYDQLIMDTNLVMFDYPLDVEISEGENTVKTETGPNGFKYLYTKLAIGGYKTPALSNIQILDSLYIPIEADVPKDPDAQLDEKENMTSKTEVKINFNEILDESMRITGHLDNEIKTKSLFGSRWRPSATIKAWDDQIETYIPLNKVKVRSRHLLHWETRSTNEDGYVKFGTFRYAVNYRITWEGDYWDIRDGNLWQAYYNGPKLKSHWNLYIKGNKSGHYAMIHRACRRYFHEDIGAIKRPHNFLRKNIKIAYLDKNNDENLGYFESWTTTFPIVKNVTLYSKGNNLRNSEFQLFSTALHEMAHYAHCLHMGNIQFPQVSNNIVESWARAIQWHLGRLEYSNLKRPLNSDKLNDLIKELAIQDWGSNSEFKAYSPLFIDLIDEFNQSTVSADHPNDNVTGYTMSQLNNILMKSYGLSSLKSQLKKNKPDGVTDQLIDQLFLRYEQLM